MGLKFLSSDEPNTVTAIIPDDDDTYDILPMVFFSIEAQRTIDYIVDQSPDEIAWLGLVEEVEDGYLVQKIVIPEQEVSGTTVDISAEAMGRLVNELMDEGLDPSLLRYHGHSHVNMAVHPSTTDQDHISEYLEGVDWFIRSIHNKKGDRRVDVFEKFNQRVVNNADSEIWELRLPDEHFDQIDLWLKERVKEHNPKPKGLVRPQGLRKPLPRFIDERALTDGRIEPLNGTHQALYGMRLDDIESEEAYYEALIDPFYKGRA